MLLISLVVGASIDCADVRNLASGLNMHLVQPDMMTKLNAFDCCDSINNPSILCVLTRVKNITWNFLSLNGTLNMSALPATGTHFRFIGNVITGGISHFPDRVDNFYGDNNRFNGSLPAFPSNAYALSLSMNQFSGDLPEIPVNTRILALGTNAIVGQIPALPPYLIALSLLGNYLTGPLPPLGSSLQTLYVYNNNLNGTLPLIPYGVQYLKLGPFNQMSGSANLSKPYNIDLRDNFIYDLYIKDTTALSQCNLDNTPLLNKVTSLTMCSRNKLYAVTSLSTKTSSTLPLTRSYSTIAIPITDVPETSAIDVEKHSTLSSSIPTTALSLESISNDANMPIPSDTSTLPLLFHSSVVPASNTLSIHSSVVSVLSVTVFTTSYLPISSTTLSKYQTRTASSRVSTKLVAKPTTKTSKYLTTIALLTESIADATAILYFQPITLFLVLKLLVDFVVFLYILKTLIYLKKTRKLKRVHIYTQSEFTQPYASQ